MTPVQDILLWHLCLPHLLQASLQSFISGPGLCQGPNCSLRTLITSMVLHQVIALK